MIAVIHTARALGKASSYTSEQGGLFGDVGSVRVLIFVLLVVPALCVAAWICRKMELHGDSFYESKAAAALCLTAIVLSIVVSGLLEEWLGK